MMRKILHLCGIAILIPFSVLAISLDEIQNNPDKFTSVFSNQLAELFVNRDSLKIIRYAPPYYVIEGTYFLVSYHSNFIMESTISISYDYNKSAGTRFLEAMDSFPDYNLERMWNEVVVPQLMADSGLIASDEIVQNFDLTGTPLTSKTKMKSLLGLEPIPAGSPLWYVGNYFFEKCYNINFTGIIRE